MHVVAHLSRSSFARHLIQGALLLALAIFVSPSLIAAQQVLNGEQENSLAGFSSSSAGDINSDGFSDVLVAAPYFSGAYKREGKVTLYLGSAQGVSATPAWILVGGREEAQLGTSVSTAGDVNKDGFADVIIGVPFSGQNFEGEALLFLGSASGLSQTPNWVARGTTGLEHLGASVAHAGDVNKDGFADVIVGAPGYSNGQLSEGRALVFLGSQTGLAPQATWNYEGNLASSLTGTSVNAAGDVNGDGFGDVIVGAPQYTQSYSSEGIVSVFLGSSAGLGSQPVWTFSGSQNWGQLGLSVATAGDVDRDGFGDVLVGHPGYGAIRPNGGRVLLFKGSASGLSATPAWSLVGGVSDAQLGATVASAGDLNNDGFSDVILGVRGYLSRGTRTGAAFIFLGSKAGPPTMADWTYTGLTAPGAFGASASSAGDINGDGLPDIVVGDPFATDGSSANGAAYVFFGARSSTLAVSALSCTVVPPTPTPSSTQTRGPRATPTPSPTVSASPTNGGSPNPDSSSTPPAGLANPNGAICTASTTAAQFSAYANSRRSGCKTPATAASRRRWSFESKLGSASLGSACDTSGGSVISSLSATGTGIASGDSCQGKRRFSLAASWSAGKAPRVSFKRLSAGCSSRLKGQLTRSLRVSTNAASRTATITGRVRTPLSNCSGWRAWEKFEMTVVAK